MILLARAYDRWLERETDGFRSICCELTTPMKLKVYESTPKANNVRNNGPGMMRLAAKSPNLESCRSNGILSNLLYAGALPIAYTIHTR